MFLNRLRVGVVRTAHWPALGRIYRAVYRVQIDRAVRLLERVDGVRAVLLRGSARGRVAPGLSDIDFVVVLRPDLSPVEELGIVDAVNAAAARVNRLAPLVGDIHIVTEEELRSLGRLGGALGAMAQDATCVVGSLDLPAPTNLSVVLHSEALVREALFWTGRAIQQLMVEPPIVGQRLAARSLAKADVFIESLTRGEIDIHASLRRCRSLPEPPAVDWAAALQRLWQCDGLLTEAPEVPTGENDADAPAWTRMVPRLERWATSLGENSAVASVVLSAEGACEHDVRLFVGLHPSHPEAEVALRFLRRSLRRTELLDGGHYSRAPLPLVVTTAMLRRPGFIRSTATEPWARVRFGATLLGEPVAVCGRVAEATRGVALSLAGASIRARELWRKPSSPRVAAQWVDLADGLIPTARALVESGEVRAIADGSRRAASRVLRNPEHRIELYRMVHEGFRVWLPRLLSMIESSSERDTP